MSVLAWVGGIAIAAGGIVLGGIVLAFWSGLADDWDNRVDRKRGQR